MGVAWSFAIWGDVSAGGTELTWSASAVVGYHFGARDQFGIRFGYRHLAIETEEDDRRVGEVESEIVLTGPVLGFSFGF